MVHSRNRGGREVASPLKYRPCRKVASIMFINGVKQRKVLLHFLTVLLLGLLSASIPLDAMGRSAAENRHELVLRELELTPTEETEFWPLYEGYSKALLQTFEQTAEVAYRVFQVRSKISDALADEYTDALIHGDLRLAQIHLEYQPRFRKVLDARRTARLFQLERRLQSYMSAEISREFPLVR